MDMMDGESEGGRDKAVQSVWLCGYRARDGQLEEKERREGTMDRITV